MRGLTPRFGFTRLGGAIVACFTALGGHAIASVAYHGGPVLSNVQVIPIFWGPNVNSTIVGSISGFYREVTDSPYLDGLDEYYSTLGQPIGRGTVVQSSQTGNGWKITPHTYTGTQPTETNVINEIAYQINQNTIPFPHSSITSDPIYMVYFPPGYTITGSMCGTSCGNPGYCGCHIYTTQTFGRSGTFTFTIGLIPDFSGGCGGSNCGPSSSTQYQNVTTTSSHELAEAITDPFGTGWWTSGSGEIGDPCQDNLGTPSNQFFLFGDGSLAVQKLWSNAANGCVTPVPKCQEMSDFYGISHSSGSMGFAPTFVQNYFILNGCTTDPTFSYNETPRLCQNASDLYGISPSVPPSSTYAPASVATWESQNGCGTYPQDTVVNLCQRASNAFGIVGGSLPPISLGSADTDAENYWYNNNCERTATQPTAYDVCTAAASMYRIQWVGHWSYGWAPPEVQSWWNSSCSSGPAISIPQACQFASNMYGIVANQTWGGAPANVQSWWTANSCSTSPTCGGVGEMFGATYGVTWGATPSWVQSWWSSQNGGAGCFTQPKYGSSPCQALADTFGIVENLSMGFAPSFIQSYWTANHCTGHPRSNLLSFAN